MLKHFMDSPLSDPKKVREKCRKGSAAFARGWICCFFPLHFDKRSARLPL